MLKQKDGVIVTEGNLIPNDGPLSFSLKLFIIKSKYLNVYYKIRKRGMHARIKHVWYAAVQMNKTSLIKHENKKYNLSYQNNFKKW